MGVSRRDLCVEIFLVSVGEFRFVYGVEVKEMGGAVDFMVEFFGVG